MSEYSYRVFGLNIRSEIRLPELRPALDTDQVDITILRAGIHAEPPADAKSVRLGRSWGRNILLEHPLAGRMLATEYATLHVEQKHGVPERNVRAFILGPGLAAAIYSIGKVPIHVSGLLISGQVYAFTGPSGVGKSTLTAFLNKKYGFPIFTDDVAMVHSVSSTEHGILLHAGPPRIKLWEDALEQLNIPKHGLTRDTTRHNKYHLTLPRPDETEKCQPLHALVYISRTANAPRTPLLKKPGGFALFQMAMNSIYRPELAGMAGDKAILINAIKQITSAACYVFEGSNSFDDIDYEMDWLHEHILAANSMD